MHILSYTAHSLYRMIRQASRRWNHTGQALTLSGPAFSVIRQAQGGGLRGPDAKNQS